MTHVFISRSNISIIEDIRYGNSDVYGAEPLRELLKLLPESEEVRLEWEGLQEINKMSELMNKWMNEWIHWWIKQLIDWWMIKMVDQWPAWLKQCSVAVAGCSLSAALYPLFTVGEKAAGLHWRPQ